MGNRAVLQFSDSPTSTGIYLHWNGSASSVDAFLAYAREVGVRTGDDDYAIARLTQIIGNFFGGTTSIGVGPVDTLDRDNGDNGTFHVRDLQVVRREFSPDPGGDSRSLSPADLSYRDAVLASVREVNDPIFKRKDLS